jgi:hypothetical protein
MLQTGSKISMSSYLESLKYLGGGIIKPAIHELLRTIPDSLFVGSAFFSLLTQSFPLGIFTLAMAEFGILNKILGGLISQIQGNSNPQSNDSCSIGLPSPYQISVIGKILGEYTFPSGPLFFLSAAISYVLSSTYNFQNELEELSKQEPEWKARLPMSTTFSILFLVALLIYRISFGCDNIFVALGSALFGALAGFVVYIVHVYLFGRDAVNFLGLPLLADRAANGRPLYVCAKQD